MALNKPLNYESRIAWIDRHIADARKAIQGKNQSGFNDEQFNTIANINDALTETLNLVKDLVKDNT